VSTQLRLVEPPEPRANGPKGPKGPKGPQSLKASKARTRTTARGRVVPSARTGRRATTWGDWHLDARTRKVGRAGVAAARRALEAAAEQELSRAS
jgi:hypothetical protein